MPTSPNLAVLADKALELVHDGMVIGLGSGSMAAHARKGDVYRFYDIDPKVLKVATEHFTYLKKIPAARDWKVCRRPS